MPHLQKPRVKMSYDDYDFPMFSPGGDTPADVHCGASSVTANAGKIRGGVGHLCTV